MRKTGMKERLHGLATLLDNVPSLEYSSCMDRTIVLRLHPTPQQAGILHRTLREHTECFNAVCSEGFTTQCSNGVVLHKETYYPLRVHYPDLPAQLVCAARVKATEAVKSALTWQKKQEKAYPKKVEKAEKRGRPIPVFKPVRCPHSTACPIRYDARSYWIKWTSLRLPWLPPMGG